MTRRKTGCNVVEKPIHNQLSFEAALSSSLGRVCKVAARRSCSGGCIHRAEIVNLVGGATYFVKSSCDAKSMFAQEAAGLSALQKLHTIRVPNLIAQFQAEGRDWLVLEVIEQGSERRAFWEEFGRSFARTHRIGASERFGWMADNYIGTNLQSNTWCATWPEFFASQRIEFQLQLAVKNHKATKELLLFGERFLSRLEDLLDGTEEPAALLHGDLWSGNFMCDAHGAPVIFDPAVYYGHREADLAMTFLFGGFADAFYSAYEEEYPLPAGWRDRIEVYQLYHLLNHLNLFGNSYMGQCISILKKFSR